MSSRLINALLAILSRLPRHLLQTLGAMLGWLHHRAATRAAMVTQANLTLCFPNWSEAAIRQLARASLKETGKTMMEAPAVWLNPMARLDRWIEAVEGEAYLERALASSRGLLILLPHIGNWELFNVYFRRQGQMTGLYQPPRQRRLHGLIAGIRTHHGNKFVPATRAGLVRLYRTLAEGGSVVVLPDQVPTSGRFVPFFGQSAMTDELSVRLIRKTDAIAIGAAVLRLANGRFKIVFREPDDSIYATDAAQAMMAANRLVEDLARLDLTQYQWEYKRFRKRPPGEPRIYGFNKLPGVH